MAHFAKIENDRVTQVIVVNNEILLDANGIEDESLGVTFCKSLYGEETEWIQTSYNGNFRGRFASGAMKYNREFDRFEIIEEIENAVNS